MNKLIAFIAALLLSLPTYGIDRWKAYMAYHDVTKSICLGDTVYVLASGNLYRYLNSTGESVTLDKTKGMSDTDITHVVYNRALGSLIVVYSNFNIDILTLDHEVINISQYKNSDIQDKTILHVTANGKYACLSTNFGVVLINMEKAEITNAYTLGIPVKNATVTEDAIYALTDKGLYCGRLADNLLDKNNWQLLNSEQANMVFVFGDDLYATKNNGLYSIDEADGTMKRIWGGYFPLVNSEGDYLLLCNNEGFTTMTAQRQYHHFALKNSTPWVSHSGNNWWLCMGMDGMVKMTDDGQEFLPQQDTVQINSPIRNLCYFLRYSTSGKLLVGGGKHNYDNIRFPGTVMTYENGIWTNFSEDSIAPLIHNIGYFNVTSVEEDPNDANHHYATNTGGGLLEFRNGQFVHLHDCYNSPLKSILPNSQNVKYYVRTSGLAFDPDKNLWMINNEVDTIIRILRHDGTWDKYYIPAIAKYPTFDKIYFDSRGWTWATHRRKTAQGHHAGLLCINNQGTYDNHDDDDVTFQYRLDGTEDNINELYDIVEDKEGVMWIGTSMGPFVLRNPETIFENKPSFERIVVPRNDGTQYGDYLLDGVTVTDIEVDGGNRKWIATAGAGVYLISPDGLTIIKHFTRENSPLLSNVVSSILVNGETGEVLFGTDAGLIGYYADATEPEETLSDNRLKVYPNPVRPGFQGNITATGFTYNSDVKVTTAGGQLVYKGTSVGGTFTWNGRTNSGKNVAPGVYYIIGSDENGKKGASIKVLIMR